MLQAVTSPNKPYLVRYAMKINPKIHHVAIQTRDFEKALYFYTQVLGFKIVKEPFSYKGLRTLTWIDMGGMMIELFSVKKGREGTDFDDTRVGSVHIAFEVENLSVVFDYLRKHNIRILKEPFKPPTSDPLQPLVGFIAGPDGEEIEFREFIVVPFLKEELK
jgi:glyoxylase I family protein